MATVTQSFSQFAPNILANSTGVQVVGSHMSVTVTWSPSSIGNLVQVPNGATLTDFWLRIQSGAANQVVAIGSSATNSGIMSATTVTQTYSFSASNALDVTTLQILGDAGGHGVIRAPGGTRDATGATTDLLPVRISLSDDATPNNIWVQMRLTAGNSASGFYTFMLFYTTNGLKGRTTIR